MIPKIEIKSSDSFDYRPISLTSCVGKSAHRLVKKRLYNLKMDKIIIEPRVRWSLKNNEFTGLCGYHKDEISDYRFNSWLNLVEVKDALEDNRIHTCKEARLVIGIGKIDETDNITKTYGWCSSVGIAFDFDAKVHGFDSHWG